MSSHQERAEELTPLDHSSCGTLLNTCVHFIHHPERCPTYWPNNNPNCLSPAERTAVNENLGPLTGKVVIGDSLPNLNDPVVVGDLDSNAKGSGARRNAGKSQLDLIPVAFWHKSWRRGSVILPGRMDNLLGVLTRWQAGNTSELSIWLESQDLTPAVPVLEFGATKYKAWNWAKGMPWSVCVGCILRHCKKILEGEEIDPESGATHWGHIICNVIFLAYYAEHYPEGDDRPPRFSE
jgi:hypothetical protein